MITIIFYHSTVPVAKAFVIESNDRHKCDNNVPCRKPCPFIPHAVDCAEVGNSSLVIATVAVSACIYNVHYHNSISFCLDFQQK